MYDTMADIGVWDLKRKQKAMRDDRIQIKRQEHQMAETEYQKEELGEQLKQMDLNIAKAKEEMERLKKQLVEHENVKTE